MEKIDYLKAQRFEIYIGLKDKDSYTEIFTVEDFQKMLSEICIEKNFAFSLAEQIGGYSHNKGYTTETSLRIDLIGAKEEEVIEIGERMKKLINTDTIMITNKEIEYALV